MNSKILIFAGIGIIVLAGGFFFLQQQADTEQSVGNEQTALAQCLKEPIVFEEYDANTLASYLGKPVVVNSWAAWCPFCIKEMPDFAQVQKEFEDKVVIVLVNRAETAEQAQKFICELDIRDDLTYLLDEGDEFYKDIDGLVMPETIFVDAKGVTQLQKRGIMTIEEMRQRIKEIL